MAFPYPLRSAARLGAFCFASGYPREISVHTEAISGDSPSAMPRTLGSGLLGIRRNFPSEHGMISKSDQWLVSLDLPCSLFLFDSLQHPLLLLETSIQSASPVAATVPSSPQSSDRSRMLPRSPCGRGLLASPTPPTPPSGGCCPCSPPRCSPPLLAFPPSGRASWPVLRNSEVVGMLLELALHSELPWKSLASLLAHRFSHLPSRL